MFSNLSVVKGDVEGGKLCALAVTSAKRVPSLPNVPTVAETFPGLRGDLVRAGCAGRDAARSDHADQRRGEVIVAMAEFGMIPDQEPDRVFLFG